MTDAREIIAQGGVLPFSHRLSKRHRLTYADLILAALTAAGFRIVGPGEVDKETVETCASLCEQPHTFIDGTSAVLPSGRAYAAAIRALREKQP